ncbi:MAG: metallophosphoesterase [Deltaproteobacteria bacterium]|nr:metallophosphoesterase [Deltaproteobacteria bacterium]
MPQVLRFVLFIGLMLACVVGIHYYLWVRLIRDPAPALHGRILLTVLLVALAVSLPSAFFLSRALPLPAARAVLFPIYFWMGFMFVLFVCLLGAELVRLGSGAAVRLARGAGEVADPERRLLLARLGAMAVTTTAGSLGAFSVHTALGRVVVKRLKVELPRFPRELDGLTVVQLCDLHIGPTLGRAWLEGIVAQTNALKPDVIAIVGDLVDGSVERLRHEVAPLAQLRARHGVFFVTGNHEYYSGAVEWVAELERLGLRVLRNERVRIGTEVASFDLAGVDDYGAEGLAPGHAHDLERALAGRDPTREVVLLAHQPRSIFEAARLGVGLQLSGHTHGGQIWPWRYLVYLQQPYVSGLARHDRTLIYVSEGTGFWGPPMRLGTKAEITHLTLASPSGPAETRPA